MRGIIEGIRLRGDGGLRGIIEGIGLRGDGDLDLMISNNSGMVIIGADFFRET